MFNIYIFLGVAGVLADLFVGLLRGVPDDDSGGDMSVVEAAAKGDLTRVKDIVRRFPDRVWYSFCS